MIRLQLLALFALISQVLAAHLRQVRDFGRNPTNAEMFIYVPDRLPRKPAIIVGLHWCHGTALDFFNGTTYASTAQRYGYIVLYPNAPSTRSGDGCWDVSSNATLTRLGGGDSTSIYEMTRYAISQHNADRTRVFVTGVSSGAMMTNVLLGAYPDVYNAGSAFAGVALGCFAAPASPSDTWSAECAAGHVVKSPDEWGRFVKAAYPRYRGPRPKIQLFHGTGDTTLHPQNLWEEIKQWTNVLGIQECPTDVRRDFLRESWSLLRFGRGQVEAVVELGQTHNLVVLANEALRFFGFPVPSSQLTVTARPSASLASNWTMSVSATVPAVA